MPDRDPSKITGDPDNYFLVTNAGTLKEQLTKAFNDILQSISSVTAVSVDMPTATLGEGADLYRTTFEVQYWSGDVIREAHHQRQNAGLERGGTPVGAVRR